MIIYIIYDKNERKIEMYYENMYSNNFYPYNQPLIYHHHLMNMMNNTRMDFGGNPYVTNIHRAAMQNNTFRTAIWTGKHLQVTLMSINVGEDIGLELHRDVDQFLRIEEGEGFVQMGEDRNHLNFERYVGKGDAVMVPAGLWHNITNVGPFPLKLYSIYAPPEHPFGTVHRTKKEAITLHNHHY